MIGLIATKVVAKYIAYEMGMLYTKPQLSYSSPVHYLNFILVEKNEKSSRVAYTIMGVLGDIGGSTRAITSIFTLLLVPFTYKAT